MRSEILKQNAPALRVAIIGAGLMGHWHGRAARRLGSQVVAIVDPNAERADALARACQGAVIARDASELLDGERVDAVHICSPARTHSALASQALEAGIHALVEKPMAESAEETRRLMGIAQRKSVILCPVHQVAFQESIANAAETLTGMDDPCAIDFRIFSGGGKGLSEPELDAIVGDILPHPLSVMRKLWPQAPWEPHRWCVTRPRSGEVLVAGEHAGALLSLLVSMSARPTCFEMTAYGRRGAVGLDFFHGFAVHHGGNVSRLRKIMRPFATSLKLFGTASMNLIGRGLRAEAAYPGLRQLIQAFYAAVRGGGPSPISAEDVIAVATARDAILASAQLLSRGAIVA